jgi:hypothetical protein
MKKCVLIKRFVSAIYEDFVYIKTLCREKLRFYEEIFCEIFYEQLPLHENAVFMFQKKKLNSS